MAAHVRVHLLTVQGMLQKRLDIEVGKGLRLDRLLDRLDKEKAAEPGFFRSVLKGRQGVTLLLNGERLDIMDVKKTEIHEGEDLTIMSPITGG